MKMANKMVMALIFILLRKKFEVLDKILCNERKSQKIDNSPGDLR